MASAAKDDSSTTEAAATMNGTTITTTTNTEDPTGGAQQQQQQQQQHDGSNTTSTSSKRTKTDTLLKDVMSPEIIETDMTTLQSKYRHAKPYPYGLLPNLFQRDFLKGCIREIKDNSTVNFKESDLFRVYQSIDLANLDAAETELRDRMPRILQLRSVLYSDEWRRWMEDFCQLPRHTLSSNQVDCACNCHASGCHLLCHDDVIGTRKISYILYLTDDGDDDGRDDWTPQEGGALELYDSLPVHQDDPKRRIPAALPAASILPLFNHMAFFVVQPGVSFHAVQEVLGDRRPRLSLQGWYHAAAPPANSEQATLQRLKSYQGTDARREEDTEGAYTPIVYDNNDNNNNNNNKGKTNGDDDDAAADGATPTPTTITLSEDDRSYLAQYLHPIYLDDNAMRDVNARFEQDSSVQLRHFLNDAWVDRLQAATASPELLEGRRVDPTSPEYYQWGVSEEWQTVGPSHKQRFLEYVPPPPPSTGTESPPPPSTGDKETAAAPSAAIRAGRSLHELKTQLLQSPPFARYLGRLTGLGPPAAHRGRVRRFRPGRDYTVAHYGLLTETSVLDATLCFAAGRGGEPTVDGAAAEAAAATSTTNGVAKKEEGSGGTDDFPTITGHFDEADEIWQSGDCGGFECYIAADEEDEDGGNNNNNNNNGNEPADEYNADDDTELLSVSASNNTLSLVYRDPGTMRFIKYVGSKAPSSRWDVAMEYEVPGDDDDDDDYKDENDNNGEGEEKEEGEGDATTIEN